MPVARLAPISSKGDRLSLLELRKTDMGTKRCSDGRCVKPATVTVSFSDELI